MSKVIVLDAGHGYNTAGKRTLNGSKGVVREWTMNNNVCVKIENILKDYDVVVKRTDDRSGATDVSLANRVKQTNSIKPSLFVSIHHNSAGSSGWSTATGVETYWHTLGSQADKKLATLIQSKLVAHTGMRNRGVKQAQFYVLGCNGSIPAVLVEGGFMDSTNDYWFITSDGGQQKYADAVAEAIIEYLGLTKKVNNTPTQPTTQTPTTETKKYYRVVAGSFTSYGTAKIKMAEVQDVGFSAFVKQTNVNGVTYYRVYVGSYSLKQNAVNQQNVLKVKGISSFLVYE